MSKFKVLYLVLGIIFIVSVVTSFFIFNFYTSHITVGTDSANEAGKWGVSEWGTFGDFFGGVLNPMLSFFALLAILLTLAIQIHELSASAASFMRQSFDSSFFSLVNFHNDIVNDMNLRDMFEADVVAQGRDVFHALFRDLWKIYESKSRNITDEKERVIAAYEEFLKGNEHHVGHYFRNLYRIYKFIDESDAVVEEKEKRKYSGIIRAQLSTYELAVLFFNSLHPNGLPFKQYIEKYAVLENFRYKHMKEEFNLSESLYEKPAWGIPK